MPELSQDKYYVWEHTKFRQQDLKELDPELLNYYLEVIRPLLEEDPLNLGGLFSSHYLRPPLQGWRALELEWDNNGYLECYRLVFRVDRRVTVIAFALHDAAYDRCIQQRRNI